MADGPQIQGLSPTDTGKHKAASTVLGHSIHRLLCVSHGTQVCRGAVDVKLEVLQCANEPWIIQDACNFDEGGRGGLCDVCRRIDFHWLLQNEVDTYKWHLEENNPRWSYINPTAGMTFRFTPEVEVAHPFCVQIPPDPGWHRFPRIPLGFLVDIVRRDTCPFCRLVTRGVYNALGLLDSDCLSID